ncbi:hypothetical protein Agub_g13258 [Astrephomene gubernaculifera]|uniref:Nudix hydrolase domain-containing protein n=1 Tax=Astrephomene gubernaculifera TaxID=47775 RepID=A0AAD3DZY3_9CHLO|nr:hypothetical protein Agub_g13258 [Astrephomene gubernaculifera]
MAILGALQSSLRRLTPICSWTAAAHRKHRQKVSCSSLHHSLTDSVGCWLPVPIQRTTTRTMSCASTAPEAASHHSSEEPPVWLQKVKANFCRVCGGSLTLRRPSGEREWRHVCGACGYVDYLNPKMVVGCCVEHRGKLLLCRRAIEPSRGLWTLPAGFMELNESTAAGAARETREEANAEVQVIAPYAHWDIPIIGQTYIIFRAQLAPPYSFSSGPESLEVALFEPDAIPWSQLAFSSVAITLRLFCEDMRAGAFRMHHGVIAKRPGSAPNELGAFELRDHMAMRVTGTAAEEGQQVQTEGQQTEGEGQQQGCTTTASSTQGTQDAAATTSEPPRQPSKLEPRL